MRLFILALFALNLAAAVEPGDFSLDAYVFGKAYHFERDDDWNENNPGLAVGLTYAKYQYLDLHLTAGTYKDSYHQQAQFALGGFSWVIGDRNTWHGRLGIHAGFYDGSGFNGVGVLPIAAIGYDRVELCATYSPQTDPSSDVDLIVDGRGYPPSAMIAAFIRVRVYDF